MKANFNLIKNIIEENQPWIGYKLILKYTKFEKNVSEYKSVKFESNVFNNRRLDFSITEIIRKIDNKRVYFFIINIKKTTPSGYDEDTSIYLDSWLREKQYDFNFDDFNIYPDEGDIEAQFAIFFNFIDEILKIEELDKIIKGEYWEFKTTDWSLLGKF